jgi:hypothetical protein
LTLRACPNRFFLLLFVFLFLVVVPALFVLVLFVFFVVPIINRQDTKSLHFRDLAKIFAVYAHGNTPPCDSSIRLQLHPFATKGRRYNWLGGAHEFRGVLLGSIRIDGVTYEHDVIIDRGAVPKRKKPSKQFREEFGHTPVSVAEESPGTANAW